MTSTVQPPPGPTGPVGQDTLNAEQAWTKMLRRFGVTNPKLIQASARLLDEVDRAIGIKSNKRPF